MGKKILNQNIKIKSILDRKEDLKKKYIYLIEYSNGDKIWKPQRAIKKEEERQLLKNYDKKFPKIERRGRKKKNIEKRDNEIKNQIKKKKEKFSSIKKQTNIENKKKINNKKNNKDNNKKLYKECHILENELFSLKTDNLKINKEINNTINSFDNLSELLKNMSKDNEILKNNIKEKNEELNSLKDQFHFKKNNIKKWNTILKKNKDLKINYWDQKIEKNNLEKKINDLTENNQLLMKKNQEMEEEKLKIINEYNEKNQLSKNILDEKDLTITQLKEKIQNFENGNLNIYYKEIEQWKEKYDNLNEQYGKLSDALQRIKHKNTNLSNIYEIFKKKYGEI